jgi:hypothetical protein
MPSRETDFGVPLKSKFRRRNNHLQSPNCTDDGAGFRARRLKAAASERLDEGLAWSGNRSRSGRSQTVVQPSPGWLRSMPEGFKRLENFPDFRGQNRAKIRPISKSLAASPQPSLPAWAAGPKSVISHNHRPYNQVKHLS